jgi:hypothetical protein
MRERLAMRLCPVFVAPALAALASLASGCIGPELTRSTDLAHLEVDELDMYIGQNLMWGQLHPVREAPDPCAVLGTDFHARVNTFDLDAYPGSREESCTSPTTSQPCEEQPAYCDPPYIELDPPPPLDLAKLVIADRSREITCDLGDAFVPRTMTRLDGDWDVTGGEQVTVRVAPASDLTRFTVDVYLAAPSSPPLLYLPFEIAGDTVTFTLPAAIEPGTTLYVHTGGEGAVLCDVPAAAFHEYSIGQPLTVHP